ncbi:hypothetical protein [Pleomorphomonas carboxyditropha]|uniref:Uncharacterized protein n=1 Tax=Pleomorphomonas carboxyditropha TaxID=2023338 RepID=A0A2G9WZR3_9HYPH|nr:hypothetical protein [Pleomorphomonas carboxyditropha]PIP00218.1 hypothetical protein CJ014_05650 [Pleomorphomonas carboxyditropha]
MASRDEAKGIASSLPGRLRLRHAVLRRPAVNAALAAEIGGWPGVTAATGSAGTGGLLVAYDVETVGQAEMEARSVALVLSHVPEAPVDAADDDDGDDAPDVWERVGALNRPAKIGMFATLGASMAALAVSRRVHAAFGGAYLGLLAIHLLKHRRKLVR